MDGTHGKKGGIMEKLGKGASNELATAKETTFPDFFKSLEETKGLEGVSFSDMPSRKESNFPEFFDQSREVSGQNEGKSSEVKNRDGELYNTCDERIKETPKESTDRGESDNIEKRIEKIIDDYIKDLKNNSECPETIPDKSFEASGLKKETPEEIAEKRVDFDNKKLQLKKDWEKVNGCSWPKYKENVYSSNGKLIRKAGSDYDAHHIQPLSMGGKNVASNITPLHADVHYDKQGVHASDSPCSKLNQMLRGGMD